MFGYLAQAFILSAAFLLAPPQQTPAPILTTLPPCPQTCTRAARCCELGCPPSEDINCVASTSEPTGQCMSSLGYVEDIVVLSCSCSTVTGGGTTGGVAYQTNCADQ
jgi:hypothetical protein